MMINVEDSITTNNETIDASKRLLPENDVGEEIGYQKLALLL